MKTNHEWTRMDTKSEKLLLKEEVFQIDKTTDHERRLTLNYLRITGLGVGVTLNFKHRKLEWERTVL